MNFLPKLPKIPPEPPKPPEIGNPFDELKRAVHKAKEALKNAQTGLRGLIEELKK